MPHPSSQQESGVSPDNHSAPVRIPTTGADPKESVAQLPPHQSVLAASFKKSQQREDITKIRPYICKPLPGASSQSDHIAEIPELTNLYEDSDQATASRIKTADPYLLRKFAGASTNILLLDPRINGGHLRGFIRSKDGFHGSALAQRLRTTLLNNLEARGHRRPLFYMTNILDKTTLQGAPLIFCRYHVAPAGKADFQRIDALTRPICAGSGPVAIVGQGTGNRQQQPNSPRRDTIRFSSHRHLLLTVKIEMNNVRKARSFALSPKVRCRCRAGQ